MIRKILFPLTIVIGAMLAGAFLFTPASAQWANAPLLQNGDVLCGDGSEADNYGFTYDYQQTHWTVDWENYVSEDTVNQVDLILDRLNYDNIAQTMILFIPQSEVGNRVNCAVHFLRYMKLGQPEGERKDNGFVFLIVVEDNKLDVHYGVGLGLPALTAQDLTPLNRLAETTYTSTGSMDQALLALVKGFDEYSRSKYTPWHAVVATPLNTTSENTRPVALNGPLDTSLVCCLICLVFLFVLFLIFIVTRFGGRGGHIGGGGFRPINIPSFRPPSFPGGFPGRGGSGSGRSGRGN